VIVRIVNYRLRSFHIVSQHAEKESTYLQPTRLEKLHSILARKHANTHIRNNKTRPSPWYSKRFSSFCVLISEIHRLCFELVVVVVVKEYQELTPLSRICTRMAYAGVPYFQMG